jgi:hypothetical protein
MREPQLLFYLLAAVYYLYCFKFDHSPKYLLYSGVLCGIGLLTRLTVAITLPLIFVYLLFILSDKRRLEGAEWLRIARFSVLFAAPIVVALGFNGIYNYAQFGGITASPYAEAAQFTTPLFVGAYGLLLSSGKSLFLYAPLAILAIFSISYFGKTHKAESYLFGSLFLVNLLFFSKFVAWAGDGSWGPRYLISTLPFLILPVGSIVQVRTTAKRVALSLAAVGLIVQLGGISIYFGNYHRELGEFPYTKTLGDPEFLYKSHFIPNYSPVVGHWKMLVRNLAINLSDKPPRFTIDEAEQRIPVSEEEKRNLLYTLDFWFMYAAYAGMNMTPVLIVVMILALLTITLGFKMSRSINRAVQPPVLGQAR